MSWLVGSQSWLNCPVPEQPWSIDLNQLMGSLVVYQDMTDIHDKHENNHNNIFFLYVCGIELSFLIKSTWCS